MEKYIYLFAAFTLLASCTKDNVDSDFAKPELVTLQARDVFYNRATLQGECNIPNETIVEQGFELSTSPLGTANSGERYAVENHVNGKFSIVVGELTRNTRYYVRVYLDKGNGQTLFGNTIVFNTESAVIDPPSAPEGYATVIDARTVEISGDVASLGDGKLTEDEAKRVEVKYAAMGIYYWRSDDPQGRANAKQYTMDEKEANEFPTSSSIVFYVPDLSPRTNYKYVMFIKTGAYYYTGKWAAYSDIVESPTEGEFTTHDLSSPEVATIGCQDITPTSVVVTSKLVSNGSDPNTVFGVEYRKDGQTVVDIAVANGLSDNENKIFSVFIKALTPNTKYYCRAFASNEKARVTDNTEYSFTTDNSGKPYVDSYPSFDYQYRVANFTSTSVVIRAKLLSDGGAELSSKGFYWGTTPQQVDAKSNMVTVAAIETDGVYDYFETTLIVPEGVIYYKPFAVNNHGETIYPDVLQVSTAISGGNSWMYMYDIGTSAGGQKDKYMYLRMSTALAGCLPLTYYELDPIVKNDKTYYLLDRNLNASAPYEMEDIGGAVITPTAGIGMPIRYKTGAYYQWGYSIPSVTAELPLKNNLTDWGYKAAPAILDVAIWPVNPCPEGYDLPTEQDLDDMLDVAKGSSATPTLSNVFDNMRLGPTAYISNNGGVQTNTDQNLTWNSDATLWIKEASSVTASSVYRISRTTGTGATVTYQDATFPRINCVAIRCVRVSQK